MIYDLKNQLHRDQFSRRSNTLLEKGQDVVELKVRIHTCICCFRSLLKSVAIQE